MTLSLEGSAAVPANLAFCGSTLWPQRHRTALCAHEFTATSCCRRRPRSEPDVLPGLQVRPLRLMRSLHMADIGRKGPGKIGGKPVEFSPGRGVGAPGGDESGDREREGGGVAVITKTKPAVREKEKTAKEPMWRVLLHNDNIHTFDYVTYTLVKVVKTLTRYKAHRITVHAHKAGVATVTTTWKQLAEEYCQGLQREGLTSSIMPDHSSTQ
ncbi:hypothetical protein CCYA_CCYA16G4149 [Cyanidiococcus yangmingshanensis]|nr:hypothetical protein CCYA_CCYA16G4149 [Cyanidiococcus yangmingshanensis]